MGRTHGPVRAAQQGARPVPRRPAGCGALRCRLAAPRFAGLPGFGYSFVMHRIARVARATSETEISLTLDLDGGGQAEIATGIGFLDHMLTALTRHALFDLQVSARGDLHVDAHHTTEDVGIVLGTALRQALADRRGISRFGHAVVPMDESLVEAAVDLSGRPFLAFAVPFRAPSLGGMDTELFEEFFRALAFNGGFNLHIAARAAGNAHHMAEAAFKATARALRSAVALDPRVAGAVPSTKGVL